jgi:uncharacterized protein involved in exopolysaccharide biosynthesis
MAGNNNGIELRDYIRVFFSRAWWFAFVTLGVVGLVSYYSFYEASKVYVAENEILVTDKYAGSLPKDIASAQDWISRMRGAEADAKRTVPATEIICEAATTIGMRVSEQDVATMVESFGRGDLRLDYSKEGTFIRLSYQANDPRLAAAVLSTFMKRVISACVTFQVQKLNTEVETLSSLRASLAADVAASERKLDEMRTMAPELRLTASTMALLKTGKDIPTLLSTEQTVAVFLELQREVITLDSQIADTCEQTLVVKKQISEEAEVVPTERKLETLPAVIEATKRRDALKLQLAQLLGNSTAEHPMVKQISAELKSLDAYLESATRESTIEIIYEANQKRRQLEGKLSGLQSDLAGLQRRKAKIEENAEKWRRKLDSMPADLRVIREATLDYENKADKLLQITNQLVQAQIKRNLELDQAGTYYRPQWDVTPVPERYDKPKHLLHLALGLVLGMMTSVFLVYAIEFADHSVKDQRDLRTYSKTAVLGVISDYNQLNAVVARTATVRVAALRQYILAILFICCAAVMGWAAWRNWPKPGQSTRLPASLSTATVSTVEEAMRLYSMPAADLSDYMGAPRRELDVTPAVEVPSSEEPEPALSE